MIKIDETFTISKKEFLETVLPKIIMLEHVSLNERLKTHYLVCFTNEKEFDQAINNSPTFTRLKNSSFIIVNQIHIDPLKYAIFHVPKGEKKNDILMCKLKYNFEEYLSLIIHDKTLQYHHFIRKKYMNEIQVQLEYIKNNYKHVCNWLVSSRPSMVDGYLQNISELSHNILRYLKEIVWISEMKDFEHIIEILEANLKEYKNTFLNLNGKHLGNNLDDFISYVNIFKQGCLGIINHYIKQIQSKNYVTFNTYQNWSCRL